MCLFLSDISNVVFDAKHVYLQLQVTNFRITEVTKKPKKPNLKK